MCDPPPKLVDIILASRGDWAFPVVRGVLTTPTLRPDGSLLTEPGYDPVQPLLSRFPSNLVLPEIPDAPTRAEAGRSAGPAGPAAGRLCLRRGRRRIPQRRAGHADDTGAALRDAGQSPLLGRVSDRARHRQIASRRSVQPPSRSADGARS